MQYVLGNMLNGGGGLNADGLALDLQFALDKTMTARKGPTPVFTRASSGTFVGSNGLIQTAATNIPRFDHTSVGVCRGLLIEESRTNLWLQSENFASASWTKGGGSISNATNTSPNGSATSELFSEDTSMGSHRIFQSSAYVSGTSYTISIYLKFAGRQYIAIQNPSVASGTVVFDIQNGTVTLTPSGTTASITSVGNGWYRCSTTATATSSLTGSAIIAGSANSTGGTSYTGSGGPAFYIYGGQVEAGSFATSYIPTTTASVVRSADVCSITGANFSSIWNTSGSTIFVSGERYQNIANTFPRWWEVHAGTGTNAVYLVRTNAREELGANGSPIVNLQGPAGTSFYKNASVVRAGDYASSQNGLATQTSTNALVPSQTQIAIGCNFNSTGQVGGALASFRVYKKRLPNAKLQSLTA